MFSEYISDDSLKRVAYSVSDDILKRVAYSVSDDRIKRVAYPVSDDNIKRVAYSLSFIISPIYKDYKIVNELQSRIEKWTYEPTTIIT